MNPLKKFIIKSLLGDDFSDPNKAYSFLNNSGVGFGGYNFSTRKTKNFIKEGYVSNPDVFAVVSKIAQSFSSVKWCVKTQTRQGIEEVYDSELNRVLACPNQLQTWSEFQESAAIMYLLTGNTYINGTEAVGFKGFRELSVLPSQVTAPVVGNEITPVAGYEMQSTEIQKFTNEEVAHIKAFDPRIIGFETLIGLSPLEAAMFVYSANNEQWEAMASMLKNKGAMGIVTSRTDRGMRKDDAEDMQKQYRDTFGGGKNFGSPMFTGANVDFLQMGMSSTDLQMIEQGVLSLRAICNIYKVSSRLFNDPANSTFNNVQQAEKAMWNDAVIPLLEKFKQRYNSWLAPSFGEEFMLDYDLTGVDALQADAKTRAEVSKIHFDTGNISMNEYRKLNGLEPLETETAEVAPNLIVGFDVKDLNIETKESYSDYPKQAVQNAKKGIELNEAIGNSCATAVGKQRGQDIANRRALSYKTIKRTYSYLSRAEEYYNPSDEKACGTISYLLWGGKSMKGYCKSVIDEVESE